MANWDIEAHLKKNMRKILKMRDMRDYKERVKKFLKVMFINIQAKLNKSVRHY